MNVSVSRDGVEIGEWSEEEVSVFYKEGQLLPTDYYWKEGMTEWKELRGFIKPPPPVPSTSSQDKVRRILVSLPPAPPLIEPLPDEISLLKKRRDWKTQTFGCLQVGISVVVTILMFGFSKELSKDYPRASFFMFVGGGLGSCIGSIPYFTSRFLYGSTNYTKHNRYLWIGAYVGAALGLAYIPLSFYFTMQSVLANLNATLPLQVDQVSRLDNISMGLDRLMVWHYTYTDENHPLTSAQIESLRPVLRQTILRKYEIPSFKLIRDYGVAMQANVYDKAGNFLLSVQVGPSDVP